MKQHTLSAAGGSRHKNTRRGIGDTFAGRGVKGQKARVGGGRKYTAGFEGGQTPLIRRMPKLGGFQNINRTSYQAVNVGDLEKVGGEVSPATLKAAKLIRSSREPVKILGFGALAAKVAVTAHAVSAKAKELIEKAGGSVTLLPMRDKELRGKKPVRKKPMVTKK